MTTPREHGDEVAAESARILDAERERLGYSFETVAERAGLSTGTQAYRHLRAGRPMPLGTYSALCAAVGLDPMRVMSDAEDRVS